MYHKLAHNKTVMEAFSPNGRCRFSAYKSVFVFNLSFIKNIFTAYRKEHDEAKRSFRKELPLLKLLSFYEPMLHILFVSGHSFFGLIFLIVFSQIHVRQYRMKSQRQS